MKNHVWVLVIEHKYGFDTFAFSDYQKAENRLFDYVKMYWTDASDDECPEDAEEAIAEYFNSDVDEWYVLEQVEIDSND